MHNTIFIRPAKHHTFAITNYSKLSFQKTSDTNWWSSNNLLSTKRVQLKQKTASKLKPTLSQPDTIENTRPRIEKQRPLL